MTPEEDYTKRGEELLAMLSDPRAREQFTRLDLAARTAIHELREELRAVRANVELGRQARHQLGSVQAELAAARAKIEEILEMESRTVAAAMAEGARQVRDALEKRAEQVVSALEAKSTGVRGLAVCTCILSENAPDHRPSNAACQLTRAKRRAEGTVMA